MGWTVPTIPIDITARCPIGQNWIDVDLGTNNDVPAGTKQVWLRIRNTDSGVGYLFGIRPKGSSATWGYQTLTKYGRDLYGVKLDNSRVFQIRTATSMPLAAHIVAYSDEDTLWVADVDKSLSTFGSYQLQSDASIPGTAKMAYLEMVEYITPSKSFGLRPYGETYDFYNDIPSYTRRGALVGLDSSQQWEQKAEDTTIDAHLWGYLNNAGWITGSLPEKVPTNAGAYYTVSVSEVPDDAIAAIFMSVNTYTLGVNTCDIRHPDDTAQCQDQVQTSSSRYDIVAIGSSKEVEIYVSNKSYIHVYLAGWLLASSTEGGLAASIPNVTASGNGNFIAPVIGTLNASLAPINSNQPGWALVAGSGAATLASIRAFASMGAVSPETIMREYYYQESQMCSSLFPMGARIREDKWSAGQQFISSSAKSLAHVRELIRANTDGTNLMMVHLNELDTLYTLYLGGSFEFSPELDDPREFSYRVPFIRGQINTTWYPVNVCEPNNLETLDKTLPNRWSVAKTLTLGQQILASTAVKDVVGATLQPMSVPGHVFVSLVGSEQKGINFKDELYPSTVLIKGQTTKGTIEEEVMEFPCDITLRSRKRYSKIISVRPLHIVPDTAVISVKTADGHPQHHIDLDHFIALDRTEQYPFWNMPTDTTLECSYLIPGDEKSFVLTPLYKWNLINDIGAPLSNTDFCIMPHCPYIIVTSGTKIHFYHKFLEYPDKARLDLLVNKTDGCLLTVDSSDFFPLPHDVIELSAAIGSSARKAQHFRWEIAVPSSSEFVPYGNDGNFNLVSGIGVNDTWIGVNYIDNEYKPQFFNLPVDESGDYLVALIASNQDGTISKDIRLVRAMEKSPVLTFNCSTLVDNIDNVFVDSNENVWIADGSAATSLKFHKDMALVDYIKKVVVFHERYDEVEVIP